MIIKQKGFSQNNIYTEGNESQPNSVNQVQYEIVGKQDQTEVASTLSHYSKKNKKQERNKVILLILIFVFTLFIIMYLVSLGTNIKLQKDIKTKSAGKKQQLNYITKKQENPSIKKQSQKKSIKIDQPKKQQKIIPLNPIKRQEKDTTSNKNIQNNYDKPIKTLVEPKINEIHNGYSQHSHNAYTFNYPTLGIKTPSGKYNNSLVLGQQQKQAFQKQLLDILKPFNDTDCQIGRIGDDRDGGYIVCQNFIQGAEALINFGVQGRDMFGCGLTTKFKMPNYQFDCTNPAQPTCTTNDNNNKFSFTCLSDQSESVFRNFISFQDVLTNNNLNDKQIVLKIDIEGGQWPGFKYFPLKKFLNIKQIVMEVHLFRPQWGHLDIFKTIMEHYVNVNLHMNNNGCVRGNTKNTFPSNAYEVTLIRKDLIKLKSNSRSFVQPALNRPNNAGMADCQVHQ